MFNRLIFATLVMGLAFVGAGCITVNGGATQTADGGVWKSTDRGDTWQQKVAMPTTTGQKASIGGVSVAAIAQDPSDANAIYLGTAENGLYYSYDGGGSWFQPAQLNRGRVPAVAVDPKDKCRVYAAAENKLLKTEDCSRTWAVTYLDTRTERQTVAVLVDHFNPSIIWIANDAGEVLQSKDGGASWASLHAFKSTVVKLVMSPTDSRRVYVATKGAGVWRTDDGGENFTDLAEKYSSITGAKDLYDLVVSVSAPDTLILAAKAGLLRTTDAGEKWEQLNLLTPAGGAVIYSVAVDPKDANVIYYGTVTAFYKTLNGGVNWAPKKLPTSRVATQLLADRANPGVIYMGVTKLKQ
jgi:photosystem II stability/assembly factor-like uncharacterized protein